MQKENSGSTTGWALTLLNNAGGNRVRFRSHWTTDGTWVSTNAVNSTSAFFHVVVTYSNGATTNDASIYLNRTLETLATDTNPTGTYALDAGDALRLGLSAGGAADFNGLMGWVMYHDAILSAADVNRHYWWGCAPGGPSTMKVWHPLWSDSLANKGTAVADGAATGTTMASIPRVERMWGSLMGCGR